MYCNTQATLYSYRSEGVYTRRVLDVFWDEEETVAFSTTGARSEAKAFITIPYGDEIEFTKEKDRIVKGVIGESVSVSDLIKSGQASVITGIDLKHAGSESMWHWEVTAK
jgi:hypothetical protein